MWMLVLPLLIALALGTANPASAQSQGRLSVSVEGVRNDSGSVRCGLYSDCFWLPARTAKGARARPGVTLLKHLEKLPKPTVDSGLRRLPRSLPRP
jgi:uncharacterized protein (DUF2141 family)